jgi:hypothetical protein
VVGLILIGLPETALGWPWSDYATLKIKLGCTSLAGQGTGIKIWVVDCNGKKHAPDQFSPASFYKPAWAQFNRICVGKPFQIIVEWPMWGKVTYNIPGKRPLFSAREITVRPDGKWYE